MKTLLILILTALTSFSQEIGTYLSSERVEPGDAFILTLYGPESIGVSWSIKSATPMEILDRDMSFTDPTLSNSAIIGDFINSDWSDDLGGSIDPEGIMPNAVIQLVLRAPSEPGDYLIYTNPYSIILLPGWVWEYLPGLVTEVHVAYSEE